MNDQVIISIVTWNRRKELERCINSIFLTSHDSVKILITDNGSTDGTYEYLQNLLIAKPDIFEIVFLKENHGISKARNSHWIKCRNYDVIKLDDDAEILTDNWINIFKSISKDFHAVVAAANIHLFAEDVKLEMVPDTFIHSELCGGINFIPREVVNSLGIWREDYGLYGYEDLDYTYRAKVFGYELVYTKLIKWNHLIPITGGRTTGEMQDKYWKNIDNYRNLIQSYEL